MTVITTDKDANNLMLTLVADFDAEPERVWDVWADPRKLERWWGPPTFPATFTRHNFTVGGESRYHMTGPAGEISRGWWRIDARMLAMGMQEGMTLAVGQIDALLLDVASV